MWERLARLELSPDPGALNREVDSAIEQAVLYAHAHSPFYQRLFRDAGLVPQDIRSVASLGRVPCTTKDDLAAGLPSFCCVPHEAIVDVCTTSGTTGAPTLYPLTARDAQRLALNEYLSFHCAGLTEKDSVFLAVTLDRCFMAGLAYYEGVRAMGATAVRIGPSSPAMLLSWMEQLKPTAIVAVPSFLKRAARYAEEHRLPPPASSVAKLICIGEPLRERDLSLNPLGRQVQSAWNARLHSSYGITELAISFCECEAGCGNHLHPGLVHVEILDDNGRPVPDGEEGEIVATTFGVEAMPLLRYRTGDRSFLVRERCACGRWTPRLGLILGRKKQAMKLKGTTVYPAAVQRVLDGLDAVQSYVMIVTSPTPLSDELDVVVALEPHDGATLTRVRDRLQAEIKVSPSVRSASLEEIERLQMPDGARKRQVFIDERPGRRA
ncbi:MAG TPA: AMP-binding protein [Candidatus Hydrogenedentes bacterium]|nr:AMP-binding protein [Candidatus Hydrogenedentota bacterium]HOS02994.1 AMP-binding protein [Candidatus Hydrogenedentota bacterium]